MQAIKKARKIIEKDISTPFAQLLAAFIYQRRFIHQFIFRLEKLFPKRFPSFRT